MILNENWIDRMIKNKSKFIKTLLTLIILTVSVKGQFYPQKFFTVDDGLSQSIVNVLFKDSYGFLWLGTTEGVSRFDGKSFKNYNQETGYSLHLVSGIIEKEPGTLWIADYGFGLFEFKNDKIQKIVFDSTLTNYIISFMYRAPNGEILLGTSPGGLYRFVGNSIKRSPLNFSTFFEKVISAAMDNTGNIWVGTFDLGAGFMVDDRIVKTLTTNDGLPSNEIRAILPQKDGKVWFGTGKGLYVLHGEEISDLFNKKYPNSKIMNIYAPDSENVYVNINNQKGGVIHFFRNKIIDEIDVNESIFTKCTLRDNAGILYIGTYDGLAIIPDQTSKNYDQKSGLTDLYIRTITSDPSGRLWVGTKNNGLFYWDKDRFKPFSIKKYGNRFETPTTTLFYQNQFWIGTRRGLLVLEGNKSIHNAATSVADSLEIRKIILIDSTLYIVSKTHLFKFKDNSIFEITYNLKDKVNSFWGVNKDRNGTLWLASNGNGLWTLSDSIWTCFNHDSPPKHIYGVRKNVNGDLLFPSSLGAFWWNGKKLFNIYEKNGYVWDVISSGDNEYWLGTSHGLVHKQGKNQIICSRKNGFVSTEYNIGSFYRGPDQNLWFGGVTGLVVHNSLKRNRWEEPPLVIESIQNGDSTLYLPNTKKGKYEFSDKNIKITYNVPSFKNWSMTRYRYFLEGFDSDTSKFTNEKMAKYTNLSAGNYIFHVYASLGNDNSYFNEASISFYIEPEWYETWWAILIYALVILFTVYYIIHWREKLLRRRNMLLEQRIEERMFELRASNRRLVNEVNERIRAEKALEEEKEQLSVTLAAITDGVIRLDEKGHVILMNAVARDLCGLTHTEAIGAELNSVLSLLDETSFNPTKLDISKIEFNSENKPFTLSAILKNKRTGQNLNIYLSIAPIVGLNTEKHGFVCVFRDVTLEKKAEEETIRMQKLESIGLLAGGLAHDFNNILSGILGNTQLARMVYEKGEKIEKYLIGVEDATKSAAALTQQLLTFSKGGEPVKKQIDLKELLEETILFALRGSNVKSVFFIENKLWLVNVDAGQINQVINNLAINADQAMPNGGTLTVEASNVIETNQTGTLNPGKYVEIKLIDQGIGIPESDLSKIFDPYFTTKQKGSGLGLASSYSIIEKHDGIITVQSEPGKGTIFTIYLPAYEGNVHKSDKESRKIEEGSGRILVMDDESYIRELMQDMLDLLGYESITVSNGDEAIKTYTEALNSDNPFRAVIMDLTIPGGMGGKDAIRELLKIDPHVKSIVSSGYSADSIMANYGDFGFKGILQKPFRIEEVGMMLDEVLNK